MKKSTHNDHKRFARLLGLTFSGLALVAGATAMTAVAATPSPSPAAMGSHFI